MIIQDADDADADECGTDEGLIDILIDDDDDADDDECGNVLKD